MTIEEELKELEENVFKGLRMARKKMIAFKKYKKTPIIVSRNGKVVELSPEEYETSE